MANDKVFGTLVAYHIWLGFAGGMVLFTGTFSRIPAELVEAGRVDGMNTWQEFWKITIPMSFQTISIGIFTGVIGIFTSSPSTFGFFRLNAPSQTYTFGYYIFNLVYGGRSLPVNYPYTAACSLIFTAIAAPLSFTLKYLLEKYGPSEE